MWYRRYVKKKSSVSTLSETKYKLKVDAPAPAAPTEQPISEPADDAGFDDLGNDDMEDMGGMDNNKPFDEEPFDAGVDADEDTDPKKFIQQLTGKLGQSLRKYSETQGQPDFELEKFAINSLLSATNTSQMNDEDKDDIIKKINTSGNDNSNEDNDSNDDNDSNEDNDSNDVDFSDNGDNDQEEDDLNEFQIFENDELFLDTPKKNNMFQDGSNDILAETKPCWKGYKQIGMKQKGGKEVPNCVPISEGDGLWANIHAKKERGEAPAKPSDEEYPDKKQWDKLTTENTMDSERGESMNYMFWQNLETIHHASGELLKMNRQEVDAMCANGHAWAVDHVSSSTDDMEEVYHFFEANMEDESMEYYGDNENGYEDEHGNIEGLNIYEGKNDDKTLNKPTKGDVKKFKVYVKNSKGNVVKINFGDPNMEIKRDDPKRKKAFRARHNCAEAKDKTTPKYWSCKMWSNKPVSKIVAESLLITKKNVIFDKKYLRDMIKETFNQEEDDMSETKPMTKPMTKPETKPSRRSKPFLPSPIVQPDPKAMKEQVDGVYFETYSGAVQFAKQSVETKGFEIDEDSWSTEISFGRGKPRPDETRRHTIELTKNGKPQRKALAIQVYNRGVDVNTYELNFYVN